MTEQSSIARVGERRARVMAATRGRGTFDGWSALAVRCGSYDQAHLGREVKRMTGLTPTSLRNTLHGVDVASTEVDFLQALPKAAP